MRMSQWYETVQYFSALNNLLKDGLRGFTPQKDTLVPQHKEVTQATVRAVGYQFICLDEDCC